MKREPCPVCREKGGDNSGDNLVRYPDGKGYCFVCKSSQPAESAPKAAKSKLTLDQVSSYPIGCDPSRGVSEAVANAYGVRYSVDTGTGECDTVYYPYVTDVGETAWSGVKVRHRDKRFLIVEKLPGVFGKQACKGSKILIVTEGEEDALAAKTMLIDTQYGAPRDYDVVSLPNGASLDKTVRNDVEFFEKYKRVYLNLDNDQPGKDATEELADWMATFTSVFCVELDKAQGKDASDYLKAGKGGAYREALSKAKLYEPEGVVNGVDITIESLLEPLEEGYIIPYPGLQDKLHGLRKSEIVTLCAGSGIGKSTLSRELAKALIEQGCSVANVSLEDQMNVAAQALIALDMDIPLNKFRFNPPTKEQVQPHYEKMVGNGKTFFYKHFGGLNSDTLMNKLYYYARSKQCDFIILDHLSLVISASGDTNERKAIDTLMTQLAKMVVETGVGLIQIVHLKRPGSDKSFAKGGEVELSDLRGSAALEQLSWCVVGLERDQQGEDSDFTRVRVLKNRTFGFTGLCDTLKYDTVTGRLKSFSLEEA